MMWAEFRAWARSIGVRLPRYPAKVWARRLRLSEVGSGHIREYGPVEQRRVVAHKMLSAHLGADQNASNHSDLLKLQAIDLAASHTSGSVVISDGIVTWHPEPEPDDWPALLAKGATVIPCG